MLLIKGGFGPQVLPGVRPQLNIKEEKKIKKIFVQVDIADLYECGDVRKFLNIVTKSNLFR